MRASVFRLSPFLLLAAALVALAVLFAPGAQPAQAQSKTVWSATLTVGNILTNTLVGCDDGNLDCSTALTSDSFSYAGTTYRVTEAQISLDDGRFWFGLDKVYELDALSLIVDGETFPLASANVGGQVNTGDSRNWDNSGLSWAVGDTVELSLTEPSISTVTLEYWSDTLEVQPVDYGFGCGYRTGQLNCVSLLTDENGYFMYHGVQYRVLLVHVAYGDTLQFILDSDPVDRDGSRTERARMALNVGTGALSKQFLVKDAQVSYGIADGNAWTNEDAWVLTWTNSGLSWSDGDSVSLSLVTLPAGGSGSGSGSGSGQQSAPAPQDPTAVTLALGNGNGAVAARTVGEDAGNVALTATLDAPAPHGGITLRLFPGPDDTAAQDADYTMPDSINIPAGERSGTALVRVTDDALDEDDETANITAFAALFDGDLIGKAVLTITDDDTAGVTVSAASPLTVAEGASASYTVVLDSQPTADVTVTPTSDDPGAATVSPASHVFSPSGWNTPATFTVSGVADTDTSDESVGISHSAASDDALYGAVIVSTVPVRVSDTTTTGQENQEQGPQEKYADLIARMKEWRNDPCCVNDKAHTDRWDRALLAFGETVADTSLEPMTAAEAQTYADRGWTRWEEVAEALRELENQAPTVDRPISDATIVNESGTSQVSLSGVFDDGDGDSLTVTAASSDEAVATVAVASDYSTLTVTAKARGTATITVTANDGRGGTVEDSLTVTVKAAPTVASPIGDVSGMEVFAAQEISLSGVFGDADGDSLTLSASSSDDMVVEATLIGDALTIFSLGEGTATITVTAQDADGNTVSDAFDVSVGADQQQQQQDPPPNQAPTVASAIADATIVNQSGTKQLSLSGVFDDADGDSLTISAASSDSTKATASVASDYSTLTVSAKARGTATITVTANDGNGGTVDDTFTVTVKAAPVVASTISDVSLEEGGSQDISLSGVFSDADGDALTLSAASSDEAIVSAFEFGGTLTIVGVSAGSATITVTAQDSDGNTVSDTFDVSVEPEPEEEEPERETSDGSPTVAKPLADISLQGPPGWENISLSGVFHDPDGDGLTITVVSSDHGVASMYESMYEEGSTLTVLAMGTGTATITVTAEDPDGNRVSDHFEVTVSPAS